MFEDPCLYPSFIHTYTLPPQNTQSSASATFRRCWPRSRTCRSHWPGRSRRRCSRPWTDGASGLIVGSCHVRKWVLALALRVVANDRCRHHPPLKPQTIHKNATAWPPPSTRPCSGGCSSTSSSPAGPTRRSAPRSCRGTYAGCGYVSSFWGGGDDVVMTLFPLPMHPPPPISLSNHTPITTTTAANFPRTNS